MTTPKTMMAGKLNLPYGHTVITIINRSNGRYAAIVEKVGKSSERRFALYREVDRDGNCYSGNYDLTLAEAHGDIARYC